MFHNWGSHNTDSTSLLEEFSTTGIVDRLRGLFTITRGDIVSKGASTVDTLCDTP